MWGCRFQYGTRYGALLWKIIKVREIPQHKRYICICSLFYTSSSRSVPLDPYLRRGGETDTPTRPGAQCHSSPQVKITAGWVPIPESASPCSGHCSPLCYGAPSRGKEHHLPHIGATNAIHWAVKSCKNWDCTHLATSYRHSPHHWQHTPSPRVSPFVPCMCHHTLMQRVGIWTRNQSSQTSGAAVATAVCQ